MNRIFLRNRTDRLETDHGNARYCVIRAWAVIAMLLLIGFGARPVAAAWTSPYETVDPAAVRARPATTCTVTSTADGGAGTLRQCLLDAASGDTITFDTAAFPPASPATISLTSALPAITQGNLTLDGSNAGVILDGSNLTGDLDGLSVTSSDNTIRGLQIANFPRHGIFISGTAHSNVIGGSRDLGAAPWGQGNVVVANAWGGIQMGGPDVFSNTVVGNYIGLTPDGRAGSGNYLGLHIYGGARFNTIGSATAGQGNVIGGNAAGGVWLSHAGTMSNTVTGNIIGADPGGTFAVGNGGDGVAIRYGAQFNRVGGSTSGEGNLISGNSGNGVSILHAGTANNIVSGNYIGTEANGSTALSNGESGVSISGASYNRVGGSTTGERNVISGNNGRGISISGSGTTSNTVSGNYIGTDINGAGALGNGSQGVDIADGAQYNLIGGDTSGERNIISGNGTGISIQDSNSRHNVISGNHIGTNVSGTAAIGNVNEGVVIRNGASYNVIGGNTPGQRNLISGNNSLGVGIYHSGTNNNVVSGNYIGTNINGTGALGNGSQGVGIADGAQYNLIGGDSPDARNLIAANRDSGVAMWGSPSNNSVSGNTIGADASGLHGLPNNGDGVTISGNASGNLIGGPIAADRNLIFANRNSGVSVQNAGTQDNTVQGNWIGLGLSAARQAFPTDQAISPAYAADCTLFVATLSTGVHKSTDCGATWSEVNTGLTQLRLMQVEIPPDATNAQTAYALAENGYLFVTTDSGASWSLVSTMLEGIDRRNLALSARFSSDHTMYASAQWWAWNELGGQPGVFKSTDGGVTWVHSSNGMSNINAWKVIASPDPAAASVLFALTNGGIEKSTDGGANWAAVPAPDSNLRDLALSPAYSSDQTLFVAAQSGPGRIYRSTNGGLTWTGADALRGDPRFLAVSPDFVTDRQVCHGGGWNDWVYCSTDAGVTWTAASSGLFEGLNDGGTGIAFAPNYATGRTLFVISTGGMAQSADAGTTWQILAGLREPGNNTGVAIGNGANHNTVRDNVISNNATGVNIDNQNSSDNVIAGNLVGTDPTGAFAQANIGDGVVISSPHNTIGGPAGRNVVSGNLVDGVRVPGEQAAYNTIAGNTIGTNLVGTGAIGNRGAGVSIHGGAHDNLLGGDEPAERNVISGNGYAIGIWDSTTTSNTVSGNFIGVDVTGLAALGNGNGVQINNGANYNVIGGATAGERNVISGHNGQGVQIWDSNTAHNRVIGNYIGTDLTGMIAVPNGQGIQISNGAHHNVIGGMTSGEGNLISGNNGNGIGLGNGGTTGNVIRGNAIGVDAAGGALPNNNTGVALWDGAAGNTVGPANVIAFNHRPGVAVDGGGTVANTLTQNRIFANQDLGIDLSNGGNTELPAPVITAFDLAAGTVGGTACANCTVEVFSDTAGQGRVYEGTTVADGAGVFAFAKGAALAGPRVTTTATDGAGNTSEFSAATAGICTVTSTADSGTGTLRQCLLDAVRGDTIRFDPGVFPPASPATITLTSGQLPDLDDGNVTIDASNAGVILDGSGIGAAGDLLLDDVSLTFDGGPNQLANGDFAGDVLHWSYQYDPPGVTRSLNTGDYHTASGSLQVHVPARTHTNTFYDTQPQSADLGGAAYAPDSTIWIAATPGANVTLTWWQKSLAGGNAFLLYKRGDGGWNNLAMMGSGPDGAWGEYTLNAQVPGDGVAVGIQFDVFDPQNGTRGFRITSDGNSIKGLQIVGFPGDGIEINGRANVIGGTTAAERNVVSGNGVDGIRVVGGAAQDNVVAGNLVGTDATGAAAWGNRGAGISIHGGATTTRISGNTISGNGYGIGIWDSNTLSNTVAGNRIGTDLTGMIAVPNGQGVRINGGTHHNVIGGTTAAEGNLISGNHGNGVVLWNGGTAGNVIFGNAIGVDAAGGALPNDNAGVALRDGAAGNTVGPANVIAFNHQPGVVVDGGGTVANTLTQNRIFANQDLGINLYNGGNTELPAPVITAFDLAAGTVGGTTCANCTVEVFSDTAGQGRVYEGTAVADGAGVFAFAKGAALAGPRATATATDGAGNTSEFSAATAGVCTVTSTADSGAGTLRQCLLDAVHGDTITFDPAIFPPASPVTITLTSGPLPDLDDGNVTVDGSTAGVILDGGGIGAASDLLLDDVSLTFDGGPNQLTNGDFAGDILHWSYRNDHPGVTRSLNTGDYHTAAGSLQVHVPARIHSNTFYDTQARSADLGDAVYDPASTIWIAATPGANVTLTWWQKSLAGGNAFLLYKRSDGGWNNLAVTGSGPDGVWQERTLNALVPGDGVAVGIQFDVFDPQNGTPGFRIPSDGNTLKGLQIVGFTGNGVEITGHDNIIGGTTAAERNVISGYGGNGVFIGNGSRSNVIRGNYVGLTAQGTAVTANGYAGVWVNGGQYNTIGGATPGERNVIAGSGDTGVGLVGSETLSNTVAGNYIGTDATGSVALGNGWRGVGIWDSASYNVIGGSAPGQGNLISGNNNGVNIWGTGTAFNAVAGNFIGTDPSGTMAVRNALGVGIWNGASDNVVGGATAGERNIISGNDTAVAISFDTMSNTVAGNRIGTDLTGMIAVPNGQGIQISNGAHHNVIGGMTSGEGNLISGNNGNGVGLGNGGTTDNVVRGNAIGVDATGGALPNDNAGVALWDGAAGNTIGPANVIAFNHRPGVAVDGGGTVANTLTQNRIFANQDLGIDLSSGGNTELPAPVITAFDLAVGTVGGTTCANCTVEVFSDTAGQGRVYEGTTVADGAGGFAFVKGAALAGPRATATATDGAGNTSEFSAATAGVCTVTSPADSGAGTLRQCLLDAVRGDTIRFDPGVFPPASPVTIALTSSQLPDLDDGNVTVDGSAAGVILDGSGLTGGGEDGFGVTSNDNTIKGLQIVGFPGDGIELRGQGNVIGGTTAAERNVIGHNGQNGVRLDGSAALSNTVTGNTIGVDPSGSVAWPNGNNGVEIRNGARHNRIGGDAAGEGNLISGNGTGEEWDKNGVFIGDPGTGENVVSHNLIGVDVTGATGLGNQGSGVVLWFATDHNTIAGNTISGNGQNGVFALNDDVGNVIQDNHIGVNAAGTAALGNGQNGVFLGDGSWDGKAPRETQITGNVISGNAQSGVQIRHNTATNNTVSRNSLYANGGPAIDLYDGANHNIAPPAILHSDPGAGTADGTACPGCTVEVFSDNADEGRWFEGATSADAGGLWSLVVGHPFTGSNVRATATNAGGDTSEFSGPPPVVNNVAPSGARQGTSGLVVNIYGQNFREDPPLGADFGAGTAVTAVQWRDPNRVEATITIDPAAALGLRDVTVTNSDGQSGVGAGLFEVLSSSPFGPPAVAHVLPEQVAALDQTIRVMISGSGFVNLPTVSAAPGAPDVVVGPVYFMGGDRIEVDVRVFLTTTLGTVALTVTNPDGQSATLNPAFTVVTPLFTDVAPAVGLAVSSGEHGAAWGDLDGNGWLDLAIGNGTLFTSTAGVFSDATAAAGLDAINNRGGVAWGDYDNDGDLDLLSSWRKVYRQNSLPFTKVLDAGGNSWPMSWADTDLDGDLDAYAGGQLYRNDGGDVFTDVTGAAGLSADGCLLSAVWADYDADGAPDLYLTNNCGPSRLYRNKGDGTFEDVTATAGVENGGSGHGAAWGDYDNDGDFDLFVANNNNQYSVLYRNNGSGTFTDVTATAGLQDRIGNATGCNWLDYNLDGRLDLFVANRDDQNRLYRNNGDGTFTDAAPGAGVADRRDSDGSAVGDYDNDGDPDIFVVSGIWGTGTPDFLFRNGIISGVKASAGAQPPEGSTPAAAFGAPHWLKVKLIGSRSNRAGIGARVRLYGSGAIQTRQLAGSTGYMSQDALEALFGLGTYTGTLTIEVAWPSGTVDTVTPVAVDQTITVGESTPQTHDAAVTNVSPGGEWPQGTPFNVRASVRNLGNHLEPGIPVACSIVFGAAEVYAQTLTSGALPPAFWEELIFPAYTPALTGTYTLLCRSQLPGDEIPANDAYTRTLVVVERAPDVWTKDNPSDTGTVPSGLNDWYMSPDLWVRNAADGILTHQDPIEGIANTVYVRLRNRGNAAVITGTVSVSWIEPSLGVRCGSWAPIGVITFTNLLPGEVRIVSAPWVPTRSGHTCLQDVIDSPQDPYNRGLECAPQWVPWDNNVEWHNVNILPTGGTRLLSVAEIKDAVVQMVNVYNRPQDVDLILERLTFPTTGTITVRLPETLFDRWLAYGGHWGEGIEVVTATKEILVTGAVSATIGGAPMWAEEATTVALSFEGPGGLEFDVALRERIGGITTGGVAYHWAIPVLLPAVAPTATARRSGSDLTLTWQHASQNAYYQVWRSNSPYFIPGASGTMIGYVDPPGSGNTVTYTDAGALGGGTNYYYVIRAFNVAHAAANSNRLGGFSFSIVPGN